MTAEDDPPTGSEEGRVLSPTELDIAEDDGVTELEEGRYVVSADSAPSTGGSSASNPTVNERVVHEWLTERLEKAETRHGFDVTTRVDDSIARKRVLSDDVVEVFDGLLEWYARQIDEETSTEAVLGILLAESEHRIEYPSASLRTSLARYDLEPEDSISSLLGIVEQNGGLVLRAREE